MVVGGGTAGLAIAARLAENPTISVAVVEAGGFYESENSNKSIIPGYYNDAPISRNTNWAFTTVGLTIPITCFLHLTAIGTRSKPGLHNNQLHSW